MDKDNLLFPQNYEDSRQRFMAQVEQLGLPVQKGKWTLPSRKAEELFVDHAYWPPSESPETLVIMISGIHGSETYAASAVQQLMLQEFLPRLQRKKLGVLMVHAMNPYGFKHRQRTTESGVNLNRNFSVSGQVFKIQNIKSRELHERFFRREPVTSLRSRLFETMRRVGGQIYFDDVSLDELVKAIFPGQFERADNVEFGGRGLEPQSRALIERVRELMPRYRDVIALDVHTGLGHRNRLHLLTESKEMHPELAALILNPQKDQEFYEHTPSTDEGFYDVYGSLNSIFVDLAKPSQRVCAMTMEFGTWGHSAEALLESLNNFLVDHQGLYHGYATPELRERVLHDSFNRSYPQTDEWREAVIAASRGMLASVLQRIGVLK
jgi:predicted deacylase